VNAIDANAESAIEMLQSLQPADDSFLERVLQTRKLGVQLESVVNDAMADGNINASEVMGIRRVGLEYLAVNPSSEKVRALVEKGERISPSRILNSIKVELKLLPAGTFTWGTEARSHQVTLTKPFYLGEYEVTNAQWMRVMGSVPSKSQDDDRPVEQVSWKDVMEFCRKLSALPEERKAGRVYRLPTEAEWEYACRAGTTTRYSFGNEMSRLDEYGWFDGNSDSQTHPVGQKKPNRWGLYDMHGNVWEWCSDWSGGHPNGALTDPKGPSSGSSRIIRGGSWINVAAACQSTGDGGGWPPSGGFNGLGFRLALGLPDVEPRKVEK